MIWLLLALAVLAGFVAGGVWGAPFLPTRQKDLEGILELADLRPGQTLVEMGAGTGTVMAAAAKRGIRVVGYEINPWLWLVAQLRLLPYRSLTTLRLSDFWRADLGSADAIYVFLIPRKMQRLQDKLQTAGRPIKVISYAFEFPHQKPIAKRENYRLYQF